MEQNSHRVK